MSIRRWEIVVNVDLARPQAPRPGSDAGAIASMFGLAGKGEPLYEDFRLAVSAGEVVAVVGPSGAGKSCLLRAIASVVPEAVTLDLAAVADDDRPAIACLDDDASWQRLLERLCAGRAAPLPRRHDACPLAERMEILSRCGLAEASAMLTPGRALSGGQAYRLALARAIWRAARTDQPRLLLADEFAAVLDDATAGVLAAQAGKLAARYGLGMIISTPRAELASALGPARTVVKSLGRPAIVVGGGGKRPPAGPRWRVVRGSIADYRALGRFHYLAGPPAAHKRVWAVRVPRADRTPGGPEVAAVLVISPPVLRCRGRNVATGGRYLGANRRRAARRLNAEIECISRVVVHPIYRGCGLAVRLVRAALRRASTPLVESLAAMGAVHPFFEIAGMTCHGHFGQGRGYRYYLAPARGATG